MSTAAAAAGWELEQPRAGARWSEGSRQVIRWKRGDSAEPIVGDVELLWSTDSGKTWQSIGRAPAEAGRFLWTVPTGKGSARVRVSSGGKTLAESRVRIGPSAEVPEYRWEKITMTAAFAPRDGAGALTYRDRMWFLGGWNPGIKKAFPRICNNEVWSSADGRDWTLEKQNTFLDKSFDPNSDWEGRHTAGYAVHRDKMWIVGGDVNQGHYHFDVWNSSDGKRWTQVNAGRPVPWGPRALHYTVAFNDYLWVMGGQVVPQFAPGPEGVRRDVWRSRDGVEWEEVPVREPAWSPRGMIGGSAVHKDRIWILGGGTYDTPKMPERNYYNDVWSSADGSRWTRHLHESPWTARQYHDVAVFDGRLWVTEGYARANRNDVWYSEDGENWYEVPNTPWKPRHAASLYVHAGALWMVAGNNMEPDVWKLSRDTSK